MRRMDRHWSQFWRDLVGHKHFVGLARYNHCALFDHFAFDLRLRGGLFDDAHACAHTFAIAFAHAQAIAFAIAIAIAIAIPFTHASNEAAFAFTIAFTHAQAIAFAFPKSFAHAHPRAVPFANPSHSACLFKQFRRGAFATREPRIQQFAMQAGL